MNLYSFKKPVFTLLLCGVAITSFASDEGWTNTLTTTPSLSSGALSFGSSLANIYQFDVAQSWLRDSKWQGQSSLYTTKSLDVGVVDSSQWSVDITRRLLTVKKNTYLALGLGLNDVATTAGEKSFGMRFVASGRVGVYGPAYIFGQASLSPWMTNVGQLVNPFGKEIELGLAVDPLPFMSLRAGYRGYWLDSTESLTDPGLRSQTDGFFIGGGLRW